MYARAEEFWTLPDDMLYAKTCTLIGWIMEHGPSIHFRIDAPDRLYSFRLWLKQRSS